MTCLSGMALSAQSMLYCHSGCDLSQEGEGEGWLGHIPLHSKILFLIC